MKSSQPVSECSHAGVGSHISLMSRKVGRMGGNSPPVEISSSAMWGADLLPAKGTLGRAPSRQLSDQPTHSFKRVTAFSRSRTP